MNTIRKLNLGAIICNGILIIFALIGLIFSFYDYGGNAFKFYEIISTSFLLITALIMLFNNIHALQEGKENVPKFLFFLYMSAMVMSVGNLFLLARGIPTFTTIEGSFLHLLCPLTALVCFIFFAHTSWLDIAAIFSTIAPVTAYLVFYVIYVLVTGNDFYNFAFDTKYWGFLLSIPLFIFVLFILGVIFAFLHNTFKAVIYTKKITLYNKVKIPSLGLGTWQISNKTVEKVVSDAIKIGYRHIDTAQAYGNESGVGDAIRNSGIKRSEFFITSKIDAKIKDYKSAKQSIEDSLSRLGMEYIDLMLIHCPCPWEEFGQGKNYDKENIEVWKALEEAYYNKKIKAIGVSNFNKHDLINLINNCSIIPMVNQIKVNIGNTPSSLIRFCKDNGIVVEAYSPIKHGEANKDIRLKDIAAEHRISIPKLCIRYTLNLGLVSLPKASSYEHLKDNFDLDISLNSMEMYLLENTFDSEYFNKYYVDKIGEYYEIG